MSEFLFHNQVWRYVSCGEAFVLVSVLTVAVIVNARTNGLDYVLRVGALVAVFSVAAYGSAAAIHRNVPPQDYNLFLAIAYALVIVAFLQPWRWRASFWRTPL